MSELLGITDICRLLDRSKPVVRKYIARPDFPKPLGETAAGRVWRKSDVDRWVKRTNWPFEAGRPKKDKRK